MKTKTNAKKFTNETSAMNCKVWSGNEAKSPKKWKKKGIRKNQRHNYEKWNENEHKNEYKKELFKARRRCVVCDAHTCILQLEIGRHSFERFGMNSEQQHLNIKYKHIFNNNHVMNT